MELVTAQNPPGVISAPAFSPKGRQIVFCGTDDGTWHYPYDIYAVTLDGTRLRKLTRSKPTDPTVKPLRDDTTARGASPVFFEKFGAGFPALAIWLFFLSKLPA